MLKGVNKTIIEVNDPDSAYFERAVFYLRRGVTELPAELTKAEAVRYIADLGHQYRRRKRFPVLLRLAALVLVLTAAAVLTAFLLR